MQWKIFFFGIHLKKNRFWCESEYLYLSTVGYVSRQIFFKKMAKIVRSTAFMRLPHLPVI